MIVVTQGRTIMIVRTAGSLILIVGVEMVNKDYKQHKTWDNKLVEYKIFHEEEWYSIWVTREGDAVIHADDAAAWHGFVVKREVLTSFIAQTESLHHE